MSDSPRKPKCKFGERCYRRNEEHLNKFAHPHREAADKKSQENITKKKNEVDKFSDKEMKNGISEKGIADEVEGSEIKNASDEKDRKSELEQDDDDAHADGRERDTTTDANSKNGSRETRKRKTSDGEDEYEEKKNLDGSNSGTSENSETAEAKRARIDDSKDSVNIPVFGSLDERKKFIEEHFLVALPSDFYDLWKLASDINPSNPCDAFDVDGLELKLCGAFDVLAGKFDQSSHLKPEDFLLHCRFPLDTPEFQTLLIGPELHYGYLRDDPKDNSKWVVCSNTNSLKDGAWTRFATLSDNLIGAVSNIVLESLKKNQSDELEELLKKVQKVGEEKEYSLQFMSSKVKQRWKAIVAPTIHGGGIVVPLNGEVGYREVPESNATLKKLLSAIGECSDENVREKKMEKVQEIITYIQFANDECDYGMGLEFGQDLFASGYTFFHSEIKQLLPVAYMLLGRRQWTKILEAHLPKRGSQSMADITKTFTKK